MSYSPFDTDTLAQAIADTETENEPNFQPDEEAIPDNPEDDEDVSEDDLYQ